MRLLEAQVQELKARLPAGAAAMTVQVKICGINDPVAFDTAIAAGADWVGFNFFPPSPRFVTPARAAELSARSPGGPPRVGLFVDPTPETIAATLDTVRLDILQLYGTPDIPALRARFGLPVWRAVGVATAADLPTKPAGPTGCWWKPSRRPARRGPAATRCGSTGRCCAAGVRRRRGSWPAA